jgi:UDP:flavonoid glycosyltransferase YjiC (YdhE family)
MIRRALIAWEIGGGRGHVVHLTTVAAALRWRGFVCSAYLVHMGQASEIAAHCEFVREGPYYPYREPNEQLNPSSRYGDWLGLHHFGDAQVLRTAIENWRRLIDEHKPTVVVAEQAPGAILAARSLGVPVVHVGVPVTTPPPQMTSFPPYLPDDGTPALYDERFLLEAMNEAITHYGLAPLSALPALYTADDEVVATLDLLDRYAEWRASPRVAPVVGEWNEPGERLREEAFIYLSTWDRFDPIILTAIATIDIPKRVVIAGNAKLAVDLMRWQRTTVADKPLPPAEIARHARVLVHAGNHGMCCLGLRAGLPQVTLSGQPEHIFDGRQLANAGVGANIEYDRWSVPAIQNVIRDAWSNVRLAERAAALAEELAPQFRDEPGAATADRIEAVIDSRVR